MTRCLCSAYRPTPPVVILLLILLGWLYSVQAQTTPPRNFAVQASATVSESPARIALSWPSEGDATGYAISRRTLDSGWQGVANLGGGETSWTDGNVQVGVPYEYKIHKTTSRGYNGFGYLRAGIRIPAADLQGKIILVVENSLAGPLSNEIESIRRDLIADGWTVIRHNVSMNDSPASVKNLIKAAYNADPANVKAVFLFGHVPVPYSGDITPDGHENHRGAWPADVFYGDMDGNWTDNTVNTQKAERQANWNTPGDGKYDQSVIPSAVELMVGRVDLYHMTCYANKSPSRSEIDLMRAYAQKLNRFKTGQMSINRRGVICDNFSDKGTDPIGGSAWRNFPGFFGANNITEVPWDGYFPAVTSGSYLWSYASGGGSYYYSMGVGTSDDFALKNVRVVFTMFMGSYFGDWNNESNFIRAALGSGDVLTASYSGFPHTLNFPMGLGETIGYGTRLSQNNGTNTLYEPWPQGTSQVHISLLGDPTLRLYPVKPASNLSIASEPGAARLTWNGSGDSAIQGYHVYRATSADGPFTRVTSAPVNATTYTDNPPSGSYTYMVRAIKLEQSGSGTYLNPSLGIIANVTVSGSAPQVPAVPSLTANVVSSSRIDLQWNNVANESGYKIERKTGSGGTWAEIATPGADSTSFSNENLAASTEYFYRIRAFNGNGHSAYSPEVRGVTSSQPQPQVPSTPNLLADVVSSSRVNLQWNNVADETGYKIERKTGSAGAWAEIAAPSADVTTFADQGLTGLTEYFYRIRAFNANGHSGYSSEVRAVTHAAPNPQPPAAPVLQATVPSHSQVNLAWNDVANETGYKLERKTGASGTWAEIATPAANATSYSNTGLAASTEYFYRIRAFNADGHSPYSSEIRAATPAAPEPEADLTFIEVDNTTKGNWRDKFGAQGFAIALGQSQLSAGIQLTPSGKSDHVWVPTTTDSRALLVDTTSSDRMASAWYGSDITLSVSVAGETPRKLALYFLDWDRQSRAQKVEVVDTATQTVLDSREISAFGEGKYVVYSLVGNVQVKITRTGGPNAVVMGAFFGDKVPGPISDNPVSLSFRTNNGELLLRITGDEGQRYRLESSNDFSVWTEVTTGTVGAPAELPILKDNSKRGVFFRAHNLP